MIFENIERHISNLIIGWIFVCIVFGSIISFNNNHLLQIGPNKNLVIFGFCVDTKEKYALVVTFCFINSGIRTLNHNIIQPYVINVIQDISNNIIINNYQSYKLIFIHTIYNWFDFFMYMNILITQIDMLVIEIVIDLIMTYISTSYYLKVKSQTQQIPCIDFEV